MGADNLLGNAAGDAAKEYVSGFAAGIATVITGHPFDTVKVNLQAHNTKGEVKTYKNAWHCATRILANEGINGLYRGGLSSFIGVTFESSIVFGVYSQMKQLLQRGETQSSPPRLHVIIPSAAFGGALISFILCPSELVKCRMQVPGTDRLTGPLDCALKTIKDEGIKGIFRGGFTTFLRESIGNAVFFSTYECTRHYMHLQLNSTSSTISHHKKQLIDVGIGIFSGGLAGIVFWSTVLPLDVAKTIIQTSPLKNSISRNPFYSLSMIYKRIGLRGCYVGLGPTLLRAFPTNAAAVVAWELSAKFLGLRRIEQLGQE